MKKIIAGFAVLAIAVLLVVGIFACKQHECTYAKEWTYDGESHWHAATCEHTDKKADLERHTFNANGLCECGADNRIQRFVNAIEDMNSMSARLTLKETTDLDGIVLNGSYNVTYLGDGSARVIFEIEQFDSTFTSENPVITVPGVALVNPDGTISGDSGLNKGVHAAILLNFDLTSSKISPRINGDISSFTGAQADTAEILGVAIDSDVTVTINIANGGVQSVGVSYAQTIVTAVYF